MMKSEVSGEAETVRDINDQDHSNKLTHQTPNKSKHQMKQGQRKILMNQTWYVFKIIGQ